MEGMDERMLELKVFYENHDASTDKIRFGDMVVRFNIGLRTLKRYKKKYGWESKSNVKQKPPQRGKKRKVDPRDEKPKPKKKKTITRTRPVRQQKANAEKLIPEVDRVRALVNQIDTPDESMREIRRMEILMELKNQGTADHVIKQFIWQQQHDGNIENNIWENFNIKEDYSKLLVKMMSAVTSDWSFDLKYEIIMALNSFEYIYGKSLQAGEYATALKAKVTKLEYAREIFKTLDPDKWAKMQETYKSDDELVAEVERWQQLAKEQQNGG